MRLLQTIASRSGFREPATNARRTELFRQLVRVARSQAADLLLLPGGYWIVADERAVELHAKDVGTMAEEAGVAVIAGIDVASPGGTDTFTKKDKASAGFPYFAFAAGRTGEERVAPRVWRQTSTDSSNAWDVPDGLVPSRDRVVSVVGQSVGVLICGELFNPRARENIVALRPRLIVDLGHESMGTGVTPNMESMARAGACFVAHTHHVAEGGNASMHFVSPTGVRDSVPIAECERIGDDEFWLAWRASSSVTGLILISL